MNNNDVGRVFKSIDREELKSTVPYSARPVSQFERRTFDWEKLHDFIKRNDDISLVYIGFKENWSATCEIVYNDRYKYSYENMAKEYSFCYTPTFIASFNGSRPSEVYECYREEFDFGAQVKFLNWLKEVKETVEYEIYSKLNSGMIAELSNGERYMVLGEGYSDKVLVSNSGKIQFSEYKEDLTHKIGENLNIIKVYKSEFENMSDVLNALNSNQEKVNCIYERKNTIHIEIVKELLLSIYNSTNDEKEFFKCIEKFIRKSDNN